MLIATDYARKMALDMRMIDPNYEDHPDNKASHCCLLYTSLSMFCIVQSSSKKCNFASKKQWKKKKNAVAILQILAERIKFTFRPFGIEMCIRDSAVVGTEQLCLSHAADTFQPRLDIDFHVIAQELSLIHIFQ